MQGDETFNQTEMQAGFEPQTGLLEVIIKYNGDILRLENILGIAIELLDSNYAIAKISAGQIDELSKYPEVEYIEKPKKLYSNRVNTLISACIPQVQNEARLGLTGQGVIVAVLDSGIDYTHPDFINEDGSSRILFLWDQGDNTGMPPEGFNSGTEYSKAQIDEALASPNPLVVVPHQDLLGHGTAVAGIAAGSGAQKGAAPGAALIIVKLGENPYDSYAKSTELMRAIKYVMNKAKGLNMPIAINISYGSNNGPHDGDSLFETYINDQSQEWKTSIVVASGNEGSAGHHYTDTLVQGQQLELEFTTIENLKDMYLSLWKNFVDTFEFEIIAPNGISSGLITPVDEMSSMQIAGTTVMIQYGSPTHYNEDQEIYIQFHANIGSIAPGVWRLIVYADRVVDGRFHAWLPTSEEVTNKTAFTLPDPETTLTLPSTAENVITVGGYNSFINSSAVFSGRGYTRKNVYVKPDLVAPAVDVVSSKKGGGYAPFTGTSFAAPFVTGACALIMQWGIIQTNDPYLYGQKIKAYLKKGARAVQPLEYPNPIWGYGTLCLGDTFSYMTNF